MNATTHYQTSFRVKDTEGTALKQLKSTVYGWIAEKETDKLVKTDKASFFKRCDWKNLFKTHSGIFTGSYYSDTGDAWAMHYMELDGKLSRKRFWYSDIGLRKENESVIVSVRVSYAWNEESLVHETEVPVTTVPRVVRFILQGYHVYSGRPQFRLVDKPVPFKDAGMGKALCDFIQSPDRQFPLIVFNGDLPEQMREAGTLSRELAGKCLVAVVASNIDLADEIKMYLPANYRIPFNQFRVFFPFNHPRNSPVRHRWYAINDPEYLQDRRGIVNCLLRNHSLHEANAIENVEDIKRLVRREKLLKLKAADPEQQNQLNQFLEEHASVAKERDDFKREAAAWATEVDRLEDEVRKLDWRCKDYQGRLNDIGGNESSVDVSKLMPSLPTNLLQVAESAGRFFNRLVITPSALDSASDYAACQSIHEAWEMLRHLNDTMSHLKYVDDTPKDLEKVFKEKTGYDLALNEGKLTQKDKKLMRLRSLIHDGKEYDITPHLKHQNNEPKSVRIYFAFDEISKKIIVGHIGKHIRNATTRTL